MKSFVGQELLAYSDPISKGKLYYWRSGTNGADAETDYVIQLRGAIVPLEVKAGASTRLLSMHRFLNTHPQSSYGIQDRFCAPVNSQPSRFRYFKINYEARSRQNGTILLYFLTYPHLNHT